MMAWGNQSSKSEEISRLAKARCKERGITFVVALVEIVCEHPLMAHEAREEVLGTKLEILDSDRRTWMPTESFGGAGADLVTTAKKRAKEKNIEFKVALSEVARERPELACAAREQVLGTKL